MHTVQFQLLKLTKNILNLSGKEYCTNLHVFLMDTIKLFDSLGFIIHPKKSVVIPIQIVTFLGFVLDSRTMTGYLTQQKQQKLKNACLHIIRVQRALIRLVAQLLGLMTSSFPRVIYGPLHNRRFDMEKLKPNPYPNVGILRVKRKYHPQLLKIYIGG